MYLFKVTKGALAKDFEMCSKLTIKTPEQRPDGFLVSLLLTLNIFHTFFYVSVIDFEQLNAYWVEIHKSSTKKNVAIFFCLFSLFWQGHE